VVCILTMGNIKTDIKVKLRSSKKSKVIHLRVPESIYKMVEDLAEQNKCTSSEIARAVLIEKLMEVGHFKYGSVE